MDKYRLEKVEHNYKPENRSIVINEILSIFPKKYQNKASKILLKLREGNINLSSENFIIYPDDGSTGSSINALIGWLILPGKKRTTDLSRPFDLLKFVKLLKGIGVTEKNFQKDKAEIIKKLIKKSKIGGK